MPTTITATLELADDRIRDLICCAIEGGYCSFYVDGYDIPQGQTRRSDRWPPYCHLPLIDGGAAIMRVIYEDDDEGPLRLDRDSCKRGLQLMAARTPSQFASFLAEDEDAITGDVFLQLALLGELVYG